MLKSATLLRTQESRKGENETHFDRKFSIDDMTWRRLGNLKFNVKLHTFDHDGCGYSCGPFIIIETRSHEILKHFKIRIEYSAEGKSGSLTYNPSINKLSKIFKFKSGCKYSDNDLDHRNFSNIFHTYYLESWTSGHQEFVECEVKVNVTYKVTFELELKKIEMPSKPKLLHKLYSEGEFSDVKIFCDGKVFNCHKIILCRQSEVFERMLVKNDTKAHCKFSGFSFTFSIF